MKHRITSTLWPIIGIIIALVAAEVLLSWPYLAILAGGAVLILFTRIVQWRWLKYTLFVSGLFLILTSIFLTRSVWVLTIAAILLYFIYQSGDGTALITSQDHLIQPFRVQTHYHGIQLVKPQWNQTAFLQKQSIQEQLDQQTTSQAWNDINLIYLGGNHIIDLGNTLIPTGQHLVLIRRLYGRTQLIIPKEVGLRLNISAISATIYFEQEAYPLSMENFRWESPAYHDQSRQLNLVLSLAFGSVEVVLL